MKYKSLLVCTFIFPLFGYGSTSLRDAVIHTLVTNPEILSYQKNNKATRLYIDEAQGGYLPTVSLDLSYESEKTIEKENSSTDIDEGPEAVLKVNQTLYNGNLTYNTVLEKKHGYKETVLKNKQKINDVVMEAVNSYLDLKKSNDLIFIAKENITEHERILAIAKENEDISGEIIDRLQADSKLQSAQNQLLKYEEDNKKAHSQYMKIVGIEPKGPICRPIVYDKLIPESLGEAIDISMQTNLEIKSQLESIFKQRAVLAQEKSRFLPTLEASFTASKDKDITTDDITSTVYLSKITLSYNLFNGLQDQSSYQREKVFLFESQKKLDSITKSVEDEVKQSFHAYQVSKKKIENLKKYVELKKEILNIYQEQFEGGTRTVIDLLSEAGELFRARGELIEEEYQFIKFYYTMIGLYANIADNILDNNKQICIEEKPESLIQFNRAAEDEIEEDLADLLSDAPLGEDPLIDEGSLESLLEESNSEIIDFEKNEVEDIQTADDLVDKMLEKLLAEAYRNDEKDYIVVDDDSVGAKAKVIGDEIFKDKFLNAPEDFYTINVIAFGSMDKASQFIEENNLGYNSFAFQYGKDLNLFKVVYGVFETYIEAKTRLEMLSFPEKYYPIIEKVGKKQELYRKYNINYEIPSGENEMLDGMDEDMGVEKEESKAISYPPIANSNSFKQRFLSANKEEFTINVYTFLSSDLAKEYVAKNNLYDNSLLFRFGKKRKLIKLVHGVYKTIGDANEDLARIKNTGDNIYPVVEKIYKQRNVYMRFYNLNEELASAQLKAKNEKPVKQKKVDGEIISTKFLNSSPEYYTINITTISSLEKAKWFIDRYDLSKDAVVYQFGKNDEYVKILYGVYPTYEEAIKVLSGLDKDIHAGKPHVDKIKKHQELYRKYSEK